MEILVASTKDQKRWSYESNATTLAELKQEFDNMGIDYYGMDFTEGISKLNMTHDDSTLPASTRSVSFNGKPYSRVILLTNTKKKIESGAMSRKEVYEAIKEMGLQNVVLEACGRNYTQVSTLDLENIVNNSLNCSHSQEENSVVESKLPDVKTAPHASTVNWFYDGIKTMVKENALQVEDVIVLANLIYELAARLWEETPELDVDDMLDYLN